MLEKSFQIGKHTLVNRIIIPPIVRSMANLDGSATDKLIAEYSKFASTGASMLIVEAAYVMDNGRILSFPQLGISNDMHIKGLSQVATAIKNKGIPVLIQLVHAGRMSLTDPMAPSAVAYENLAVPREMTLEDIENVKLAYSKAITRAIDAGFDGVEIHNAHGYMLSQFLSPEANKRTDQYGGSLENRSRMLFEIVENAKKILPTDKLLSVRFGPCDMVYNGLKLTEGTIVAQELEEKSIDLLNVAIGIPQSKLGGSQTRISMNFTTLSGHIKRFVKTPIAVAGKITTQEEAQFIVESGKADLVAVCRAILADPLWPKKALGELEQPVIKCLGCLPRCAKYTTGCPLFK